jgi:hypothetical protein
MELFLFNDRPLWPDGCQDEPDNNSNSHLNETMFCYDPRCPIARHEHHDYERDSSIAVGIALETQNEAEQFQNKNASLEGDNILTKPSGQQSSG